MPYRVGVAWSISYDTKGSIFTDTRQFVVDTPLKLGCKDRIEWDKISKKRKERTISIVSQLKCRAIQWKEEWIWRERTEGKWRGNVCRRSETGDGSPVNFVFFKGASWLETLNLFLLARSCYWHLHPQARKFKRGPSVNTLWNADANDLCGEGRRAFGAARMRIKSLSPIKWLFVTESQVSGSHKTGHLDLGLKIAPHRRKEILLEL